jgi:predicted ATPase/class 3 adenylate cyclase
VDEAPSGTVTFLFTDIEGSTRLWEQHPEAMRAGLARHDACLRRAVLVSSGRVVKSTGDGLLAVFQSPLDALVAAAAGQRAIAGEAWAETGPLAVRMGLHTGAAELRDGDYFGPAANRAARLTEAANGGQVLVSAAARELIGSDVPTGLGIVGLGKHRLRDLTQSEGIYQLIIDGIASDFPPCRWADERLGNLPVRPTPFVGRAQERSRLMHALAEGKIVTVTGTGGVGKTRVAIEGAAAAADAYVDGVWFCDFAPITSPDQVVAVMAATLRVQVPPGTTLEDAVIAHLSAKQLLLVLDNCEHVLEEASRLVHRIAGTCPSVGVLATSREALGIDGEQVSHLAPLTVPGPGTDADTLASSDPIEMFLQRAQMARSELRLTEPTLRVVAEICRELDGIPLAIELAAGRVAALSPTEILDRLGERFRVLTRSRASTQRHQTLHNAVEWSYSLLDARERQTFERLATFAGGFDVSAASAVAGSDDIEPLDVEDIVGELVAKSMVDADISDAGTRYRMLESLRQFALERLRASGEEEPCRRRHASFYAAFATRAGDGLEGSGELKWRRRIALELAELRAAVTWALASTNGADRSIAFQIVASLAYLSVTDASSGVGSWATSSAEHEADLTHACRRAVLAAASMDAYASGDYERGRELARSAISSPSSGPAGGILPYAAIGLADVQAGNMEKAVECLREGTIAVDRSGATLRDRADARTLTALCAVFADERSLAREYADEALHLVRQAESPSARAHALAVVGYVLDPDDPAGGLAAVEESVSLTQAGASDFAAGTALRKAAELRAALGDRKHALAALRESVVRDYERGSKPPLLYTLYTASELLAELAHAEPATVLTGAVTAGPVAAFVSDRIQSGETERTQRLIAGLESVLGTEQYQAAIARGSAMSYEELVTYALEELDRP